MKKKELIQQLRAARAEVQTAVKELSNEDLAEPNALGSGSILGALAQMNIWEAEIVTMLFQARQGARPTRRRGSTSESDGQDLERPAEAVLRDFEGVHRQLLRRIEEFSDEELDRAGFFPWAKNESLSDMIWEGTGQPEVDFARQVRAWQEQ